MTEMHSVAPELAQHVRDVHCQEVTDVTKMLILESFAVMGLTLFSCPAVA